MKGINELPNLCMHASCADLLNGIYLGRAWYMPTYNLMNVGLQVNQRGCPLIYVGDDWMVILSNLVNSISGEIFLPRVGLSEFHP